MGKLRFALEEQNSTHVVVKYKRYSLYEIQYHRTDAAIRFITKIQFDYLNHSSLLTTLAL